MKVLVNKSYGGIGLSEKAILEILSNENFVPDRRPLNIKNFNYHIDNNIRTNPIVIEVVERLGEEANGNYAELEIAEIPDNVKWEIYEYDGLESIEVPRTIYY